MQEHTIKTASSNLFSFQSDALILTTLPTTTKSHGNFTYDKATITWQDNGDSTNFTITCIGMDQNSYCAFGLSNDQKMVKMFNFFLFHLVN